MSDAYDSEVALLAALLDRTPGTAHEVAARLLAAGYVRPDPTNTPDPDGIAERVIGATVWAADVDPRAVAAHARGVRDGVAATLAHTADHRAATPPPADPTSPVDWLTYALGELQRSDALVRAVDRVRWSPKPEHALTDTEKADRIHSAFGANANVAMGIQAALRHLHAERDAPRADVHQPPTDAPNGPLDLGERPADCGCCTVVDTLALRALTDVDRLHAVAQAGRAATLDPGRYVPRGRDEDGDYERLDRWQARALIAAVTDATRRLTEATREDTHP